MCLLFETYTDSVAVMLVFLAEFIIINDNIIVTGSPTRRVVRRQVARRAHWYGTLLICDLDYGSQYGGTVVDTRFLLIIF